MKTFIILFTSLLLSFSLFAQEKEFGVFVGATAFQGDVVEKTVDFKELNLGFGAFYRHYSSSKFSFRIGVSAGSFSGDDANSTESFQVARGYSFKSTIVDLTAIAEWNILGINIYGPTSYDQSNFSPYLLFGIGGSMYNPTVTTTNTELKPLDLGKEYPAFSMVVPLGLGLKYATAQVTVGIEASVRAGLTDYLDGISKSGNADNNDWYGFYGINAAYRLGSVPTPPSVKPMDDREDGYGN